MTVKEGVERFFFGLGWTIVVNFAIVIVLLVAAYYANDIPMVYSAPLRYSIILIPFSMAAIVAAFLSFVPYFALPRWLVLLPCVGIFLSGWAIGLFFQEVNGPYSTRIEDYVVRVDHITSLIMWFSLITALCSLAKILQVRNLPQTKETELENLRLYWVMKLLVCDVPIFIGALILVRIQEGTLDTSSQAFSEVYFQTVRDMMQVKDVAPFDFHVAEIQRQFSNANFWFGVAMGVTSAQLIMQQLSSLFLESVLRRRQVNDRNLGSGAGNLPHESGDEVAGK